MRLAHATFFDNVRGSLFGGRLTHRQVEGMVCKLDIWLSAGVEDPRWIAYMMATSFHETGGKMRPVEEIGKGRGRKYGRMVKQDGTRYDSPEHIYYGRGDVQLTWYENYERMGKLLGIDLLGEPSLALDLVISARIMLEGMTRGISGRGDFTGKSLEDYFNDNVDDPLNARRIVNGMDRASLIAGYHYKFLSAVKAAMF